MLILLMASCLLWVGFLSLAFVFLLGLGVSTGWIIAGAMILALSAWAVVMGSAFRQAAFDPETGFDSYDEESFISRFTSSRPRRKARVFRAHELFGDRYTTGGGRHREIGKYHRRNVRPVRMPIR